MNTIDPAVKLSALADSADECAAESDLDHIAADFRSEAAACRAGAEAVALVERLRPTWEIVNRLMGHWEECPAPPDAGCSDCHAYNAAQREFSALLAAAASPSPVDPPPPADDVALMAVALDHYWTWFGDDCGCPAGSTDGCPIYDGVTAARHLLPGPEGDPDSTPHPAVPVDPAPSSDDPEIVVLCGSSRFYEAFQQANYDLTMAGKIVLSIGFYPHFKATHGHGEGVGHDSAEKVALDELHKRKIDLADSVFVLNVDGYIGDSTRSEIDYAESLGRPITYLEPLGVSR